MFRLFALVGLVGLASATSEWMSEFDDEALSLMQLRTQKHSHLHSEEEGPVVTDSQGRSCSGDLFQGRNKIGPADGVPIVRGNGILWFVLDGPFRKMVLTDMFGTRLKGGYIEKTTNPWLECVNMDHTASCPGKWYEYDMSIQNWQCGDAAGEPEAPDAATGGGDVAGAVGDPHITTNTDSHFDLH